MPGSVESEKRKVDTQEDAEGMTTGDQGARGPDGMFGNRLRKNVRHFRKWARARGLTAFRV